MKSESSNYINNVSKRIARCCVRHITERKEIDKEI